VKVTPCAIPEVLVVEPVVHGDARGFFVETFQAERYAAAGIDLGFVQDNVSRSRRGVLRGLHFQEPVPQGKLVSVLEGTVWDVAVDVRVESPTFGRWVAETLSSENFRQLWVPPGFAHGFVVLSESALFAYKCTAPYRPEHERTLRWDDPAVAVRWPAETPLVSARDAAAPTLAELDPAVLPRYRAPRGGPAVERTPSAGA
jgi:dTDP-4-dehydrorhamnose 3,5-epimerase